MAEAAGPWGRLQRLGGLALVAAGVLMVVATLLHPSRETATTIIASEYRLVAAHVMYTLSWLLVLFGLPGLFDDLIMTTVHRSATRADGSARYGGLRGRVSRQVPDRGDRQLRFFRACGATESRNVLDAVSGYPPVVASNGLAAMAFMVGYALFGVAMIRPAVLPRLAGILVAVGGPAHLIGFGLAQLVSPSLWPIAVVGSISLGAGLAWPGYRLWHPSVAAVQTYGGRTPA
jgi:hypothetical protein